MKPFYIILFFFSGFSSVHSFAQTDAFTGTWQMEFTPAPGAAPISIELTIAQPEKNLLYPAEMTLTCDSFKATYHLLLVKRNIRQLGIGRNKVPSTEGPFSIGNWPVYLNGVFDLSKDLKGTSFLTAERLFTKQYGVSMPEAAAFPPGIQRSSATHIRDFLKDAEIKLRKINNIPLQNEYIDSILNPNLSSAYYGIQETINANSRNGSISLSNNKKNSGIVSVILNGNTIIDQNDLNERRPVEDIKLDTGNNILIFYADNYGRTPENTGNMFVELEGRKFSMDFANKKDMAATFIVTRIFYDPAKEKEKISDSQNSILKELSEVDLQNDIKKYHYPDPSGSNLLKNDSAKAQAEKTLFRNAKPIGSITTSSRQIILALWDDAVEDADTISLSINGHWVVQAFPVRRQPQFIQVTIDPGPNKILFVANNLGSIPPNTAVLEIIDGRQRKAFQLETDYTENNLINILYNAKPD